MARVIFYGFLPGTDEARAIVSAGSINPVENSETKKYRRVRRQRRRERRERRQKLYAATK